MVKARASDRTKAKARNRRTDDRLPVHSFATLVANVVAIALNQIQSTIRAASFIFDKIIEPTIVQQKALDLLGISLICTQ
ncbi:hypothetical protein QUB05_13170 [Microcoleus sp. F10-C6]|uniref:hypothetical protein n=1 Tax=unclassified Microcoleus TaxID=2642155 RepID=UPI002FD47B69